MLIKALGGMFGTGRGRIKTRNKKIMLKEFILKRGKSKYTRRIIFKLNICDMGIIGDGNLYIESGLERPTMNSLG